MSYLINYDWLSAGNIDINFTMALDGISIYLLLLSTLLFPICIYFSWDVTKAPRAYYSLLLILEVGVLGFFVSLDMLLFYVFFEMVLIPMYFLIGIWGGKDRVYASLKFFLYTLVGSLSDADCYHLCRNACKHSSRSNRYSSGFELIPYLPLTILKIVKIY